MTRWRGTIFDDEWENLLSATEKDASAEANVEAVRGAYQGYVDVTMTYDAYAAS